MYLIHISRGWGRGICLYLYRPEQTATLNILVYVRSAH